MSEYGNGRRDVCDETLRWVDRRLKKIQKERDKLKFAIFGIGSHKRAALQGATKSLIELRTYLTTKKNTINEHPRNN
jgi:hypothetical protein